jgi:hypothetical protein
MLAALKGTPMRVTVPVALLFCCTLTACRRDAPQSLPQQLHVSGWIEESAAQRGYIKPGDVAQFGCPAGWRAVEDTTAALRGKEVSTVYMGTEPPDREGAITCVAQTELALPPRHPANARDTPPIRQPLAPVWVELGADATTIGFRSELPLSAPIYIARETPCGPRVIGVRLGDLLNWLVDPQTAPKRDFLGMVSGGCPDGKPAK